MEKNERATQKPTTKHEETTKPSTNVKWHSTMLAESKGFAVDNTFVDGLFN
jgi:hypothetical protein